MFQKKTISIVLALFLTTCHVAPAPAQSLSLYLEGAIGVGTEKGHGVMGHETFGKMAVGVEYDQLFIEAEHVSNVQIADDHGGNNILWFGIRKEWGM